MENNSEIEKLKEKVATHSVEIAVLQENQAIIKDELKGIRSNTKQMVWILLGGVVSFIVSMIVNGSFGL